MRGGEIDVKLARVACRPARVGSALLSFRRISQISLKSWISAQEILRSDVSGFESWTNYETCNQQKTIEEEGCVVYSVQYTWFKVRKRVLFNIFWSSSCGSYGYLEIWGTKNSLLSTFILDVTRDDRDKHVAPKTEANKIIQTYVKWIRYYRLTTPILTHRTMKRVTKPGQTQPWTFSSLTAMGVFMLSSEAVDMVTKNWISLIV